jgi:ABC-type sugar transport system, periplasmic component
MQKMKLLYKISLFAVIAVVGLSAFGSLYFFSKVNGVYTKTNSYVFSDDPKYHFSLILKSGDDTYWQDFKEGAYEAGKVYNAAIEYNPISDTDSSEEAVKYINIAYESKVDGIVAAAENSDEYANAINQAAQGGQNIVVGVVENVNNDRLAYVGTNFYEYGVQAAKLIAEAKPDKTKLNLAVILSSENSGQTSNAATTQNDVTLNGLKDALKSERQINLETTLYRNSDLLGAEDMTRKILTQYPDTDVIFCTNAKDTVAATHVIIERNLVGRVAIVGTDVTTDVVNYIKKNIIFGVLDRNGYQAGYQSIGLLCDSIGHKFQTNYVDINIDAYTQVNISTYNRSSAL